MKLISKLLRRIPKRALPFTVAVTAIIIPAAVMAWGPDRPTYTMAQPADHVTFNSITDNSEVGDERNFLTIKDASNTNAGGWQDSVTAKAGHEYLVRVYVHNDAAANLNLKATNVRAKVTVPATTGKSVQLGGFITADNAAPKEIWDSAALTSSSDFNVAYVAGSARLYNNAFGQTGAQLSDNIVTSAGAPLGYDKLDGIIPGCMQYSGYVTFKIKVQGPQTSNFTMSKLVSKHGENKWVDSYAAQPGETVDYLIQYKNTGDVQQDNVVVKDTIPAGQTYVTGSTVLGNSKTPSGAKVADGVATSTGINTGSYAPGANAWVIFNAKVAANDDLPTCGDIKMTNTATVETDSGNKSDTADVTTSKTCERPKTPKYECSALSVDKISRTQFKFTASKTVENATFKKFVFVIRDHSGKQTTTDSPDGTLTYTQDKPGSYSVQATVVVDVNGQEKTTTSDNCQKTFEVTQPPVQNKYTCDALELVKKSRDTFEFTAKAASEGNVSVKEYNFDFGDGQTLIVGPGQETQLHTYDQPGGYTARVTITFMVDGKTVTGITSDNCAKKVSVEQPPIKECKPGIPEGDSRCKETPAGPGELPNTDAGLAIGGLFGTGALGLSLKTWIISRRNLRNLFKQ